MKKLILAIGVAVGVFGFVPFAYASPTSWDLNSGVLQPLQNAWSAVVKGDHFVATSTATASTFPYASTTAISASNLTSGDCVQASIGGLLVTASAPCSSGGGSGTVSTSSSETATRVPFWTTTSATPALLSGGSSNFTWDNSNNILSSLHFLATGSTTLQNFTSINATTSSATSTNIFATTASSTNLFGQKINGFGLATCNSASNALTWSSGSFGCNSITGSSFGNPFNFVAGTPNYLIGTTSPLGLIMTASTTIGGGTQSTGLTINGGATTTGFLTVLSSATSTFANGINLTTNGCYALGGFCLTAGSIGGGATQAVNWATAGALSGSPTYSNGSSGVGATLTETGTGALSIDGNNPAVNERVLIKNQSSAFQNGIYSVTAAGSGIAAYVLTRSTDYNQPLDITPGIVTYVLSGSANSDTTWAASYTPPLTLGTTNITYSEAAGTNGTVTSVGLSSTNSTLIVGSTPVTTSGTITADLNLANANHWTALQTFDNATTTLLSASYASSTLYYGANLASCAGVNSALTWSLGQFGCNTIATGANFGQSIEIDSAGYLAATSSATAKGFSVGVSGTTYGFAIGDQLVGYASSTNASTIFGQGAGNTATTSNTSTLQVSAFGYHALNAFLGTNIGDAFGARALEKDTSGTADAAFGQSALRWNTTGSNNVAFGSGASLCNFSATSTVAIGVSAAEAQGCAGDAMQGYTVVGYQAGQNFVTGADYNTLVGYQAGNKLTSGSKNIYLGAFVTSTNANVTTGSNNIVIGNDIKTPSATLSNQLNIGNAIFGTGLSGTGTTIAGSIGISTSSPYKTFAIGGDTVIGASAAGGTLGNLYLPALLSQSCLGTDGTGKLQAGTCGTGTVTSVAASVPSFLSISGSPVTTSGTLAITYSGTALPITNGGTNATSFGTSNGLVAYNGTSLTNFSGYTLTSSLLTTPNASTTALTVGSFFTAPNQSSSPTNTIAGSVVINTNGNASSSIAIGDGSNTHNLFAVQSKGGVFASSTLAYMGAFGASGSTTIGLPLDIHKQTMRSFQCYTDVGTAWVGFGNGSATTTEQQCSTTPSSISISSNNTISGGKIEYIEIGHSASAPNKITVSADIEESNQ